MFVLSFFGFWGFDLRPPERCPDFCDDGRSGEFCGRLPLETQKQKERTMSNNHVIIFDTTLRDGEQSPGASMNTEEKLVVARQLLRLNVDVIEAGFPISSPGDFESVRRIAELARLEIGPDEAAHTLERSIDAEGSRRIHGHTYTAEVMVRGERVGAAIDALQLNVLQ